MLKPLWHGWLFINLGCFAKGPDPKEQTPISCLHDHIAKGWERFFGRLASSLNGNGMLPMSKAESDIGQLPRLSCGNPSNKKGLCGDQTKAFLRPFIFAYVSGGASGGGPELHDIWICLNWKPSPNKNMPSPLSGLVSALGHGRSALGTKSRRTTSSAAQFELR